MNRRVAAASLALVALAGSLGWLLRVHLIQEKSHETGVLGRAVQRKKLLPLAPIDGPRPVLAAEYFDIAQRMLFSKDRNPTEVIEVKAPPPKPPLPPLPSYYGQVRLGEPVIFLSVGAGDQNTYRVGDKVGAKDKYVILAFDERKVTLGFNDEKVEKKLEDLRPKESEHAQAATRPAAPQPSASRSASLAGSASLADSSAPKPDEVVGAPYGSGYYACVAGDDLPDGTIKDGKKKVVSQTMMGKTCHWETVK